MPGQWLPREDMHDCADGRPSLGDVEATVGSVWQCECGRKWVVVHGYSYYHKDWWETR